MLPGATALCNLAPMLRTTIIPALMTGAALAAATGGRWRVESSLEGLDHKIQRNAAGEDTLAGWRIDGGTSPGDDLHAITIISNPERLGFTVDALGARDGDGRPSATIVKAASFPADREHTSIEFGCGPGFGFEADFTRAEFIAAILPYDAPTAGPRNDYYGGVIAAARIDLKAGTIEFIDPSDIHCYIGMP